MQNQSTITAHTLVVAELVSGVMFQRDTYLNLVHLVRQVIGDTAYGIPDPHDFLTMQQQARHIIATKNPEMAEELIAASKFVTLETYCAIGKELTARYGETCQVFIGQPALSVGIYRLNHN